jgi:NitT/TauT family transport system substrate-binding protein
MIRRREFVSGLTVAGAVGLLGLRPDPAQAEPPPETTTIRFGMSSAICIAPQFVAEELLHGEGFTDVQYVKHETGVPGIKALATGKTDFDIPAAGQVVTQIDAGDPLVVLAGIHVGCYELFGSDRIRSVGDLKGRSVGVPSLGSGHYFILATMLAHVGLHPRKDVNVVTQPTSDSAQRLSEGKLDALVAFPPEPQEMRAKNIGHVVVSTILDRPWSQYFCCVICSNKEFVRTHPVATKRATRAILKSTSICALEPERVARFLVDKGYTARYDYALQTLKDIPYSRWREYNPEDAIRFYALRLHEAGVIKSSPQKIIAQGTDWRFLNELRKELKG